MSDGAAIEPPASGHIQHTLLFEHNPLPMLAIIAASNAAVACYGYTREELLAMTVRDLTPEDDLAGLDAYVDSMALEAPGLLNSLRRQRCKDGRVIEVDVTADDLDLGEREEFMALTLLDIAPAEDHGGMLAFARRHAAGERVGLALARPRRHVTKDGSVMDVEVTSDDLEFGGRRW